MSRKILVLNTNHASLMNAASDVWEWYQLTLCIKDTMEEAIKELKNDSYHAVVVPLNRENTDAVRHQTKVFWSLTASPICVIAVEPVDKSIKLELLKNGVDHFTTAPMPSEETAVEIMAVIRRTSEPRNAPVSSDALFYSHGLFVDMDRRKVLVGATEVILKNLEFNILRLLIKGDGKVFSPQEIFEGAWKYDSVENSKDNLQSRISKLRRKIQITPRQPSYIKTHHGAGYSFTPEYDTIIDK